MVSPQSNIIPVTFPLANKAKTPDTAKNSAGTF